MHQQREAMDKTVQWITQKHTDEMFQKERKRALIFNKNVLFSFEHGSFQKRTFSV